MDLTLYNILSSRGNKLIVFHGEYELFLKIVERILALRMDREIYLITSLHHRLNGLARNRNVHIVKAVNPYRVLEEITPRESTIIVIDNGDKLGFDEIDLLNDLSRRNEVYLFLNEGLEKISPIKSKVVVLEKKT